MIEVTRASRPIRATADVEGWREEQQRLERTWNTGRGLWAWLTVANHHVIGRRIVVTAMVFFSLAGLLALAMRAQLARPDQQLIGPDLYNQIFTMHGTTMMFLFAVPVMQGLGVYLVPMMVGARGIAFPRLGTFGYFSFMLGGVMLYAAFALNIGPDTGWFAYVPLSGPDFSPGKRVDVWAQLVNFTELASLTVATQIIATVMTHRAPGMSIERIPLFVWALLVQSAMVIFAMPAVMTASLFLATDRLVGTQFFNQAEGGDPLLWQHLFWFFGHPEVYIIFIPALGIVSSIVATFCQRPIVGYTAMVLSLVATGFIGFGLWVHHMFATPLPVMGQSFFTAASMLIALPSGVQIFCWIATIWTGRPRFDSPLLFVIGFIVIFVLGGLTGVMLASVPLNLQVHDSYFVVAHFHYVLIGGAVFPLMGGLHYWYPKMTGRMLSEPLAKISCALLFVGFNLTFFPMHQLGLDGMPRRVYTYLADREWGSLNMTASIGAAIMGAAILVFAFNVLRSLRHAPAAGDDPWGGESLEWATSSPPAPYNFQHPLVVTGRHGLWEPDAGETRITGLRSDLREVLITRPVDAVPDHRDHQPGNSIWPFATAMAIAVMFVTTLFTPWGVVIWGVIATATAIAWAWPNERAEES